MIETITSIVIFCIVLLIYLHITFQLKTSNNLEIITVPYKKFKMDPIFDIRQPVMVECPEVKWTNIYNYVDNLNVYSKLNVNIWDTNSPIDSTGIISYHKATTILNGNSGLFLSENNQSFLKFSGGLTTIAANDAFLRPHFTSYTDHDILFGSKGATTPLREKMCYRTYLHVPRGYVL